MAAGAGRLRLAPIARDVLRAYRRHWRLLVPLAVVVLLPQAIGDALLGDHEIEQPRTVDDYARLASLPAGAAINLAGEAFYAGIVAAVVVRWRRGERLRDVSAAARELPLGRLIAADLVLALGTALGFVLLVVPGFVFFTYFAIAPALIELRRLSLREAFATSARLVRGNFWRVLLFAFLVIASPTRLGPRSRRRPAAPAASSSSTWSSRPRCSRSRALQPSCSRSRCSTGIRSLDACTGGDGKGE